MGTYDSRAHATRRTLWAAFAREHGGSVQGEGRSRQSAPVMDVTFGDALVRVDMPRSLLQQIPSLRARAGFLLGRGPKFLVERDPEVAARLELTFDEAFQVSSPHAHGMRIAWSARAQDLLQSLYPDASASSDGTRVSVIVEPFPLSKRTLTTVCELAAELARYGERFMAPLRAVEGAVWVPPSGPFTARTYPFVRVVRGGVEVEIHPERRKKKLAVSARAALARAMPAFVVTLAKDGASREPPAGILGPDTIDLVALVAPATLSSDGTTLYLLLDGEADTDRLSAAASFLASAAGGAKTSPFR